MAEKQDRIITRIKYSKGKVTVCYDTDEIGGVERHELINEDMPLDSFIQALQAMKRPMIKVIAPAITLEPAKATIQSVSISRAEEENMDGVTITALIDIGTNTPVSLHTPHIKEHEWPKVLKDALALLIGETQRYIDGERAQMEFDDIDPENGDE